jgi:PPOX class probable F420-dependent enzyme
VDQADLRKRVADARVARLGTVGTDWQPHLVPFCFVLDGDDLLSAVDAKPKATRKLRRLANVRENPHVCVLVDHYEDDWSRLWWVRMDGRAEVVDGGPRAERAVRLLSDKYEQYRSAPPAGPVLAIHVERWAAWAP